MSRLTARLRRLRRGRRNRTARLVSPGWSAGDIVMLAAQPVRQVRSPRPALGGPRTVAPGAGRHALAPRPDRDDAA